MRPANQTRCVYCGYPGAKMRGGRWTCFACRDLPTYERAANGEIEAMIAAYYEGTLSTSAEGSTSQKAGLDPVEAAATVAVTSGCAGQPLRVARG